MPPLLSFAAHPGLLNQLDNLLTQLSAKRQRLMGMRRESNQRMADFAVADVSLFWLLNALNTYQPVLADLREFPARHPEQVYQQLIKLAGGLLTFSLEHDVDKIPAYRHTYVGGGIPAADAHPVAVVGGQSAVAGHCFEPGGAGGQSLASHAE